MGMFASYTVERARKNTPGSKRGLLQDVQLNLSRRTTLRGKKIGPCMQAITYYKYPLAQVRLTSTNFTVYSKDRVRQLSWKRSSRYRCGRYKFVTDLEQTSESEHE